jgi:hypothetical protein
MPIRGRLRDLAGEQPWRPQSIRSRRTFDALQRSDLRHKDLIGPWNPFRGATSTVTPITAVISANSAPRPAKRVRTGMEWRCSRMARVPATCGGIFAHRCRSRSKIAGSGGARFQWTRKTGLSRDWVSRWTLDAVPFALGHRQYRREVEFLSKL